MKRYRYAFILLLLTIILSMNDATYANKKNKIIYFYSTTCSSCKEISDLFISSEIEGYDIVQYNVADMSKKSLLNSYCDYYEVNNEYKGMVSIIFVGDDYLYGKDDIEANLQQCLSENRYLETIIIKEDDCNYKIDDKRFNSMNPFSVFVAALLNSINPCSLSMMLFFLVAISSNGEKILESGLEFCIGKIITFVGLGTIFFNILTLIDLNKYQKIMYICICLFLIVMGILKLYDYFMAKDEKYGKIKAQLPKKFRKFNHEIISDCKKSKGKFKLKMCINIFIGCAVALGEFMCSGQIYLTTIVIMIHKSTEFNLEALGYLVLYSIVCVIPLMVFTILVQKGISVFEVSEHTRLMLKKIKLITSIFYFVMTAYVILFIIL